MKRFVLLLLAAATATGLLGSCGREAPVGTLDVTSDPEGLAFYVYPVASEDKTAPARPEPAPFRRVLPVGRYRVVPQFEPEQMQVTPAERVVEVSAAQRREAHFSSVRLGRVEVASDPAGAAIHVDGEDTSEVTPATLTLTEGEHLLDLVLAGHLLAAGPTSVTVDPAAPAVLDLDLSPAGTLDVTSDPAGAQIRLDGADTGAETPASLFVTAGLHVVRLLRDGYLSAPDSVIVDVPAGGSATAEFTLVAEGTTGELAVTSRPAGAAILIDGEDTGETTPHTFELPPVPVSVSVARAGFHAAAPQTHTPAVGAPAAADFTLTARKVTLVETVSGVNCVGCPAMNAMLTNLEGAYGHDVMLGVKYSGPFGGPDGFYEANPAVLQARMTVYANGTPWNWAAPTLFFNGDLAVAPDFNNGYPSFGEMAVLLDADAADDPGFAVDVHVDDWSADPLDVRVSLVSGRDVTLPAHHLALAVVENPVVFDEPQNDAGETEFHWICREFATLEDSPGRSLGASPVDLTFQVAKQADWTDVMTENLFAVVFVQEPGNLRVLQAGAYAPAAHATFGRTRP